MLLLDAAGLAADFDVSAASTGAGPKDNHVAAIKDATMDMRSKIMRSSIVNSMKRAGIMQWHRARRPIFAERIARVKPSVICVGLADAESVTPLAHLGA